MVLVLQDALFAALAAIGFSAISRPPIRAYLYCAITAAVGHSLRYVLMNMAWHMHIVPATLIAAFLIGCLAVLFSSIARFPAETCLFPALLPMIPGIYAYKCFGALAHCLLSPTLADYDRYFYIFSSNGIITCAILLCLVVGATIPIFMFKRVSFTATRSCD